MVTRRDWLRRLSLKASRENSLCPKMKNSRAKWQEELHLPYSVWVWGSLHRWNQKTAGVRVQEHQKFSRMGETLRSGLAEYAWTNGHNIHWTEAKILHKEENWQKQKFKEAVYIAQGNGGLSHPSVEIPSVWRPLLERNRPIGTEGEWLPTSWL